MNHRKLWCVAWLAASLAGAAAAQTGPLVSPTSNGLSGPGAAPSASGGSTPAGPGATTEGVLGASGGAIVRPGDPGPLGTSSTATPGGSTGSAAGTGTTGSVTGSSTVITDPPGSRGTTGTGAPGGLGAMGAGSAPGVGAGGGTTGVPGSISTVPGRECGAGLVRRGTLCLTPSQAAQMPEVSR